jgi:hypothetical protein
MDSQHLQKFFLLFKPERLPLDLLREYNNLLVLQIDDMKLHPFHKEEVKAMLQQTITEMGEHHQIIEQQVVEPAPPTQNWISRLLYKTAR